VKKFQERVGIPHLLIRAYWYNAESITPFRPYKKAIEEILEESKEKFPELTEETLVKLAQSWHDRERENLRRAKEDVFEKIQRGTDFLEFKYVGQYRVNAWRPYKFEQDPQTGEYLYLGRRVGEKGVDIGIAVDMVSKMDYYDAAILVSGDADFLPVVRYLKDGLKFVYQFSIAKGIPPHINYLSPWLKGVVDVFEHFDELELLETYLNRDARIPPDVLSRIDERINELKKTKEAR
jgi:uncharacterized LabA/DUF88 family protein